MPKQHEHKAPSRRTMPWDYTGTSRYIDPLTSHTFLITEVDEYRMDEKMIELQSIMAVLDFVKLHKITLYRSLDIYTPMRSIQQHCDIAIGVRLETARSNLSYFARYPSILCSAMDRKNGFSVHEARSVKCAFDTRNEMVEHVIEILTANEEYIRND